MYQDVQAQGILEQLTPLQKDILTLVALPQLLAWSERWLSTSRRQDAVAWGLIRRGLLQEMTDRPGEYEATELGLKTAKLAFQEDGAFDDDLNEAAIAWLADIE